MDALKQLFGPTVDVQQSRQNKRELIFIAVTAFFAAFWAGNFIEMFTSQQSLPWLFVSLAWIGLFAACVWRLRTYWLVYSYAIMTLSGKLADLQMAEDARTNQLATTKAPDARNYGLLNGFMNLLHCSGRPAALVLRTRTVPSQFMETNGVESYLCIAKAYAAAQKGPYQLGFVEVFLLMEDEAGKPLWITLTVDHVLTYLSATDYRGYLLRADARANAGRGQYWRFQLNNTRAYDPSWDRVGRQLLATQPENLVNAQDHTPS